MEPKKPPRVHLTAKEQKSAIGAELIQICQSVTEDGRLDDAEIGRLKVWLSDHRTSDIPSIEFLVKLIEEILSDGEVTEDEVSELHKNLEKILPPEIRKEAISARREIEKEEQRRTRPIDSYDFMVAGTWLAGRDDFITAYANEDDKVYLRREPHNPKSKNAIQVSLDNGKTIGYVPEIDAKVMAKQLDADHPYEAFIKKILTGGRAPIPVVVVKIFDHGSDQGWRGSPAESGPFGMSTGGSLPYLFGILVLVIIGLVSLT